MIRKFLKPNKTKETVLISRTKRSKRSQNASGLLIISSGGLGDTVLFSIIFDRFTRQAENQEEVTLLLRKESAKLSYLFRENVSIQTIDYDRLVKDKLYKKRTCTQFYEKNYRMIINTDFLRHPKKEEEVIRACKANNIIAMEPRAWPKYNRKLRSNRKLYTRLFDSGEILLDKVVRWTNFANWLNNEHSPPPKIRLPNRILNTLSPQELTAPNIVFSPFSAVSEKQYPVRIFEVLTQTIPSEYSITLVGAPNDLKKNPAFETLIRKHNLVFNSCNLEELVTLLRNATLTISVDTVTMHLSVAAGTNTLCLASAAFVGEIVPYDERVRPDNAHFLYSPIECEGCLGACIHPTKQGMFLCVSKVSESSVISSVKSLLSIGSK